MRKNFATKKLYYSISEVSKIAELEQYVLRYWETEFEDLKPAKNLEGNRIYTNKDIKLILQIKKLLRDEKYTIEGAKKLLRQNQEKEILRPEIAMISDNKPIPQSISYNSTELSLFQEEEKVNHLVIENAQLKKDLTELKSFLSKLLDDI